MSDDEIPTDISQFEKEKRDNFSPFLNSAEAARRLKLSIHTLNKWRHLGKGPQFRDHGRRIVYHIDDLDSWSKGKKRQKAHQYNEKKQTSFNDGEAE